MSGAHGPEMDFDGKPASGVRHITALDISAASLEVARQRLGVRRSLFPMHCCARRGTPSVNGDDPYRGSEGACESWGGERAGGNVIYRVGHPLRVRADDADRGCAGARVRSVREHARAHGSL